MKDDPISFFSCIYSCLNHRYGGNTPFDGTKFDNDGYFRLEKLYYRFADSPSQRYSTAFNLYY